MKDIDDLFVRPRSGGGEKSKEYSMRFRDPQTGEYVNRKVFLTDEQRKNLRGKSAIKAMNSSGNVEMRLLVGKGTDYTVTDTGGTKESTAQNLMNNDRLYGLALSQGLKMNPDGSFTIKLADGSIRTVYRPTDKKEERFPYQDPETYNAGLK